MKGNQNANMSREEFNNVQAKQVANTAYNGNELYDKGIVRGKIFVLPEEMRNKKVEITLNEGYQFVDENGNIINTTKIVLEKKKKEYPKTFEECMHVLEGENRMSLEQMNAFRKLIDARNAYWKIAGEEMGLDGPWEPGDNKVFGIIRQHDKIQKYNDFVGGSTILEFPTEEMRDAFYENFKEEIEICKELL